MNSLTKQTKQEKYKSKQRIKSKIDYAKNIQKKNKQSKQKAFQMKVEEELRKQQQQEVVGDVACTN